MCFILLELFYGDEKLTTAFESHDWQLITMNRSSHHLSLGIQIWENYIKFKSFFLQTGRKTILIKSKEC